MSVSRRRFVTDVSALGLLTALLPELAAAQASATTAQTPEDDTPHDSYDFWNGFFDSVNPYSRNYGQPAGTRGPKDQLPDPDAETQYLHYKSDEKKLRYATDIGKDELLDHDGDVAVSISLSQFRPGNGDTNVKASQLRVDTTQIHPYMNIIAPLAWTAIASLEPDKAGKVSMDQLGFKTPQATQGTSKILFTQGTGKLAVNISRAAATSIFVKALNVIMQGTKIVAPLVTLPAISVPALSAFTEVLSYWEDRTRFVMAGNLTSAIATQQALDDPDREDHYIGLLSGDYLMLPQRHTDDLSKELPNLDLVQGYLVRKDADPNLPIASRAQSAVPGVTYASMRVSVVGLDASASGKSSGSGGGGSDSSSGSSKKSAKKSSSTTGSGSKSSGSSGSGSKSSSSASGELKTSGSATSEPKTTTGSEPAGSVKKQ
jgi:hypothetical protein